MCIYFPTKPFDVNHAATHLFDIPGAYICTEESPLYTHTYIPTQSSRSSTMIVRLPTPPYVLRLGVARDTSGENGKHGC